MFLCCFISFFISNVDLNIFFRFTMWLFCFVFFVSVYVMYYYYFLIVVFMSWMISLEFVCFSLLLIYLYWFYLSYLPLFCVCYNKVKPSIQVTDLCLLFLLVLFFLVLNLKGSLLFYLWISFWTFRLLIVLYCSIKFIMSLSVISLFSFYMTNKFLRFVHFFIKWSLDSCAWHFFYYLHHISTFFTYACNSKLPSSPLRCSLHWFPSFLWFESILHCCLCSLALFSSLLLSYPATHFLRSIQCFDCLFRWSLVAK